MHKVLKSMMTALFGVSVSTVVWAQQPGAADHSNMDHSAMDHAAMGHAAPTSAGGPWSYKHRKNPAPHKQGRWEMVPVPQYGHMFISTQGLSAELRCAALANSGVMVDRATRKSCGMPDADAQNRKPQIPTMGTAPASDKGGAHSEHRH